MKYALEYDPTDQNTLTIHFNKALIEISESPEKDIKVETTYECATDGGGDSSIAIDDLRNDNKDPISPCLKMMGDTIYSLKGVKDVEICDYEIILEKSFFFKWEGIVNSVVATVLIFLEPDGKATETPFQTETDRKNKKGNGAKKAKTKTAEISWSFQEPQD